MIDDETPPRPGFISRGSARIERGPAVLARDAAITRVSRTRGWVIAGAAGLTGAFYALALALAPGHTLGATSHSSAGAATVGLSAGTQPAMPPLANPATLGLQGPGNAPVSPSSSGSNQAAAAAVASAPAVVSGGS